MSALEIDSRVEEAPGPFDLSRWASQKVLERGASSSMRVSAAISAKKAEHWALGVLLVQPLAPKERLELISKQVVERQASFSERLQLGLDTVRIWVTLNGPDRVFLVDGFFTI